MPDTIKKCELHAEYQKSHRNRDVIGYWQSHGPRWDDQYVEWLQDEVLRLRTQRHPSDVSGNYPEV